MTLEEYLKNRVDTLQEMHQATMNSSPEKIDEYIKACRETSQLRGRILELTELIHFINNANVLPDQPETAHATKNLINWSSRLAKDDPGASIP